MYVSSMSTMARLKKMVSLALDPALVARLKAWLAKQELKTTQTAVVELALKEFLDAREKGKKSARQ